MIFDSHTHIFPEKIAERATAGIGDFYNIPVQHLGTAADLTARLKAAGVCGCMTCSVATVLEQVGAINDFIAHSVTQSDGFMVGFCTLHPNMTEAELDSEITRAVTLGLRGIKLHPDFQRFHADGRRAEKVYSVIGGRLPVLIHAGDSRYPYSSPRRIAAALDKFPQLTVIAAHFGGWSEWDEASLVLAGKPNLYVDTSSSLYELTPQKAVEYIGIYGEERVLFGTDYPMWDIREELARFDCLDLSDSAREKILFGNARRLFKLWDE
jgi:hypothetical protein